MFKEQKASLQGFSLCYESGNKAVSVICDHEISFLQWVSNTNFVREIHVRVTVVYVDLMHMD